MASLRRLAAEQLPLSFWSSTQISQDPFPFGKKTPLSAALVSLDFLPKQALDSLPKQALDSLRGAALVALICLPVALMQHQGQMVRVRGLWALTLLSVLLTGLVIGDWGLVIAAWRGSLCAFA